MSFPSTITNQYNRKSKGFLPEHFWNGLLFGTFIWTILVIGAFFTDCALKIIA